MYVCSIYISGYKPLNHCHMVKYLPLFQGNKFLENPMPKPKQLELILGKPHAQAEAIRVGKHACMSVSVRIRWAWFVVLCAHDAGRWTNPKFWLYLEHLASVWFVVLGQNYHEKFRPKRVLFLFLFTQKKNRAKISTHPLESSKRVPLSLMIAWQRQTNTISHADQIKLEKGKGSRILSI